MTSHLELVPTGKRVVAFTKSCFSSSLHTLSDKTSEEIGLTVDAMAASAKCVQSNININLWYNKT